MPLPTSLPRALTYSPTALRTTLLMTPPQLPPPAERFLILVPDAPIHEAQFARYLWELARPRQTALVFITCVTEEQRALRARRRLATLASLARDVHNTVETHIVATSWREVLQALWQPGDLVFCHAEQRLSQWGQKQSLAEAIITQLQVPVYCLVGYYPELNRPTPPDWKRAILFDVIAGAFIVFFLFVQITLQTVEPVWLSQALLIGSVVLECGGLAFWHVYLFEDSSHD